MIGPVGVPSASAVEEFTNTEALPFPLVFHTATLLNNGLVLIAGGTTNGSLNYAFANCELYDPESRTWIPTGSMTYGRGGHTATLLPSGQVLVVGGAGYATNSANIGAAEHSAELYDPDTETWTLTGSIPPPTGPSTNGDHYAAFAGADGSTANLLTNGQVLVAGGEFGGPYRPYAYLYNPANGKWTQTGSLNTARYAHTATTLPDGWVLVVGGYTNDSSGLGLASAELYDPSAGTWSYAAPMEVRRRTHAATLLNDGLVLVTGGDLDGTAELYDPTSGSWQLTAPMFGLRIEHTSTLLSNGFVLVAGGQYFGDPETETLANFGEFYDPVLATWYQGGSLVTNRYVQTATLMTNGVVLIAGGDAWPGTFFNPISGAEEMIAPSLPPPTGSLKVTLTPAGAVSAGAQWQIDGGTAKNSGVVVSNLAVGLHSVTCTTNAAGWNAPAAQIVTVNPGITNSITANYTALNGSILSISLTNRNQVVIAWPYPSTGSNLQQNAFLTSTGWSAVSNTPVQVGSQWRVTVTPQFQQSYYRLH